MMAIEEAQRVGLVDRAVRGQKLSDAVQDYAHGLVRLSGNSQGLIKTVLGLIASGQVEENARRRELRDGAVSHPDFLEGRQAFMQRRPPRFT